MLRRWLAFAAVALTSGCVGLPQGEAPAADPTQQCRIFFRDLDAAVARAGVGDSEAARIEGFPYLRTDRFLASFRAQALDTAGLSAWLDHLQALAEEGRRIELRNLPAAETEALRRRDPGATGPGEGPAAALRRCGDLLRRQDFDHNGKIAQLRQHTAVPDAYQTWQRALGLYAIVVLPIARGIDNWHEETRERYAQPLSRLPVQGELLRFIPPRMRRLEPAAVAAILRRAADNPLAIPEPSESDTDLLFEAFAPVWEIDVASDDDRIGMPHWRADAIRIDTTRAVVFRRLSHTRFKGQALLQLNYIVWFPARARTSAFDLLGGHLDGITWRVTLSPRGTPLMYDSMHNCGCYHMFYPAPGVHPRPPRHNLQEIAFIPQPAPPLSPGHQVSLRIAHHTHHIDRVSAGPTGQGTGVAYQWADYSSLRSLARGDNARRSLFRSDGLVPGTERRERYLFWPMGIAAPGAMRQWGHHATAFIGRRHFDDADLMERYFR